MSQAIVRRPRNDFPRRLISDSYAHSLPMDQRDRCKLFRTIGAAHCNTESSGRSRDGPGGIGGGARYGVHVHGADQPAPSSVCVKTITVKPFGPILTQAAIAIMDRRVGITRCRVYYAHACVWTVARVCTGLVLSIVRPRPCPRTSWTSVERV